MTIAEAQKLGYQVIAASPFEVGLLKNGGGVRTWWATEFKGQFPALDHPKIQQAIAIQEQMEKDFPKPPARPTKI